MNLFDGRLRNPYPFPVKCIGCGKLIEWCGRCHKCAAEQKILNDQAAEDAAKYDRQTKGNK